MKQEEKPVYKSFLIRIQCDQINQIRQVMVMRVNQIREPHHFATLDELMIFLLHEVEN